MKPKYINILAFAVVIAIISPAFASMCIPGPVSPAHHNCINGVPYQKYQTDYCATGWVRDYNPLFQGICGPRNFTYDDGTIQTNQYLGQRKPDPATYGLYLKRMLANMSKSALSTGPSPKTKTTGYPCEPVPVTPAVRKCYYSGGRESGVLIEVQQKSDCTKEWARSNNTLLENHLCRILHIGYKEES
ncbi:MAG: hypothetical protein MSIBF_01175 [Candidatus Altiarchaeales archaeon IMC4]|nr:MAG: hypothetical protein MSIBF_01175 [Candidatus Altiarchaeales archaeon IMC4]